jgi:hypothetical protein
MKKILTLFFLSLVLVSPAQAQLLNPGAVDGIKEQTGAVVGDEDTTDSVVDPRLIVAYTLQILLSGLGVLFTGLALQSGFFYLTARGEEERIKNAQVTMLRAIIGLIITLTSYGIVRFVIINVEGAVNQGPEFFQESQRVSDEIIVP